MTPPVDQAARDAAATEFSANVVVVAGAGSGKTTLLVQRLLNLVLGRGVPLTSVVALTFTEKAAAEMRDRLAAQLGLALELLAGECPSGRDAASFSVEWVLRPAAEGGAGAERELATQRALEALSDLDGGALGTIHAYCADLLRRHPQEARLDPAFVVDDGSRLELLLDDEATRFEAETLARGTPFETDWRALLERFDVSAVRAAAAAFVAAGVTSLGASEDAAVAALRPRVAACCEALELVPAQASNERAHERADWLRECLAAWAKNGPAALREHHESTEMRRKALPSAGKGSSDPEAASRAMKQGLDLVKALLRVDEASIAALARLACELAARVRERLAREGVATFQSLLVGARDLLLQHPGLRLAEQKRAAALLLDEFQDTDPLQYEIAFLLGEDPANPLPPEGDPWQARLAPGRLFIVGDPKQSIYRFRGADMASYERAVGAMAAQGARVLKLVANFRSRAEVLAPINALCERLIVERPPYQPAYEELKAGKEDAVAGEPRVEIWTVDQVPQEADRRRLAEARVIGRWLREQRASGALASFGDAAILFRAMTSVAIYQRGLAEQGVPFVTQGGKGFVHREEVVQAVALLRALARPHDAASILAVLRSPSCGASDREIALFGELTGKRWTLPAIASLDAAARAKVPRVARTLDGLRNLSRSVRRLPADEAIRRALTEDHPAWSARLVPLHAASHGGAQRVANLEKLVTRAEELVRGEGLSLARVVERLWTELSEGSDQGESPLADEAVDAARLMSIHQCKGLEFPVVIVPDLARAGSARAGRPAPASVQARGNLVGLDLAGQAVNHAKVVLDEETKAHDEAEKSRLLYVALTRARERLILVNAARKVRKSAWPLQPLSGPWGYDPASDDPAASLLPGILHRMETEPGQEHEQEPAAPLAALVSAVTTQDAAAAVLAAAGQPRPRSASGVKEAREEREGQREFAPADAGLALAAERGEALAEDARAPRGEARVPRDIARAVGIAVHHALEAGALDESGELVVSASAWDQLAQRAARLGAAEAGADAGRVEDETRRLLAAIPGSALACELAGARVLARELPFLLELDGAPWQGFIDLVIEKAGEVVVVDWKTDRAHDASRHRAQLALYAEAVRRWRGLPALPRTALAWLDGAAWEWVT